FFERERGRVVEKQTARARRAHGSVAPDRRRGQARGKDLLRELLHRNLVVVDRHAPPNDRAGLGHYRRNENWSHEFPDLVRIQRSARDLRERDRSAHPRKPPKQVEPGPGASHPRDKRPPRYWPQSLHQGPPPPPPCRPSA